MCRRLSRHAGCAGHCRRYLLPTHDLQSPGKDVEPYTCTSLCSKSFLSSAGQSVRLLTSRSVLAAAGTPPPPPIPAPAVPDADKLDMF